MKDILDREILVGDTLAFPSGSGSLSTALVAGVAEFAMQLRADDDSTWVVTEEANGHYVICNFGYGV